MANRGGVRAYVVEGVRGRLGRRAGGVYGYVYGWTFLRVWAGLDQVNKGLLFGWRGV